MKIARDLFPIFTVISLASAFLASGCTTYVEASGGEQESPVVHLSGEGEHSHATSLMEFCANGRYEKDSAFTELCAELAASYWYKDLIDGGNDIFEPGCHRYYTQAGCPAGTGKLWRNSGDRCLDSNNPQIIIGEWTNPKCHPKKPVDSSRFDCNQECMKKGAMAGVCVTVKNFCAKGIDSAKCECIFP